MQNLLAPNASWARVIPRQVISKASNGSLDDLWSIKISLTPENCSVEVLNASLRGLIVYDSLFPPERWSRTAEAWEQSQHALARIAILHGAVVLSGADAKLRAVLVSTLQKPECVDALCRWMTLSLFVMVDRYRSDLPFRCRTSRESMGQVCQTISTLLLINTTLVKPFLASAPFIDLVIHLWTNRLTPSDDLLVDLGFPIMPFCSATWLLHVCVDDPDGMRALLERIGSKGRLRELPYTFLQRLQQLQTLAAEEAPTVTTTETIYVMVEVIDKLLEYDAKLRDSFIRNDYMFHFASALNSLSPLTSSSASTVTPFEFLKPLSRLSIHASDQSTRAAAYWSALISGGFITVTRRALESISESDDALITFACRMVTTLSLFTTYPTVIREILEHADSNASKGLVSTSYLAWDTWDSLWERAGGASKLYKRVESQVSLLCDNIACDRSIERDFYPQQCSRCSSIVYCSTKCQTYDWERFHKLECRFARENHYNRKSTGSVYTHTTRMFHMKWIESEFNDARNASVLRSLTKDHCGGHALHETLPMFQYISVHQEMQVVSLRQKRWWTSKAHWDFTQDYLEPRVSSLIDEYRSGSLPEGIRLVEGVFCFGSKKMVYLTVALERKGEKSKAVWSLAKHADCSEDT